MLMLDEDMAKLRGEVKRLEDNGLLPEDIIKRLEKADIPQDVIQQLVKLPKAASITAIPEKPDLLELCDSLAIFLDKALPRLWDRGQSPNETLVDLGNYHKRLREAVDESRG